MKVELEFFDADVCHPSKSCTVIAVVNDYVATLGYSRKYDAFNASDYDAEHAMEVRRWAYIPEELVK